MLIAGLFHAFILYILGSTT